MTVPCDTISTIEVAAGSGISVSLLSGVYTISLTAASLDSLALYKIYADTAARDADNPSPSSGDMAWTTSDDRRWVHDGTGWIIEYEPWTAFTPSSTNITLGNGTLTGRYQRRGGTCTFWSAFTLGSTSAMGTNPALGLPFATAATLAQQFWIAMSDGGAQHYVGMSPPQVAAATTVNPFAANAAVAVANATSISSTVPFTWATTDVLGVGGTYEMNSRYT